MVCMQVTLLLTAAPALLTCELSCRFVSSEVTQVSLASFIDTSAAASLLFSLRRLNALVPDSTMRIMVQSGNACKKKKKTIDPKSAK